MSYPSFSGSFDPVTRLVAHVPIKFIVGALAAAFVRLPRWVITGKARSEHIPSGLPPRADIVAAFGHFRKVPEADVDLRADTEHSRAILQRPLSGWKPTRTVPPVVDGLTRKQGPSKCLSRRNSPGSRIASTFSASG